MKNLQIDFKVEDRTYSIKLREELPFQLLSFPCEATKNRVLVKNRSDFVKVFNNTNRFSNAGMYNSIYSFGNTINERKSHLKISEYKLASVDKFCIDIDLEEYLYKPYLTYLTMVRIHCFCEYYDLQHLINFSGNGYHIYIGADATGIEDDRKDDFIKEAFYFVKDMLGIRLCDSCFWKPTTRIIRTVGSFYTKPGKKGEERDANDKKPNKFEEANRKRKKKYLDFIEKNGFTNRFCINLNHDDIHGGFMNIYKKSLNQDFNSIIYGKYRIVLSSFEIKKNKCEQKYIEELSNNSIFTNLEGDDLSDVFTIFEKCAIKRVEIPICIKLLMKNKNMRFQQRFLLTIWLTKMELTEEEIHKIFKTILSTYKYKHFFYEETTSLGPLPHYIYTKIKQGYDYDINCTSMRNIGFCTSLCQTKRVL